jgi:hypothetical protein
MKQTIGNGVHSTITVGDVMRVNGNLLICYKWSESCAALRPLAKRVHVIKPRGTDAHGDKETTFVAPDIRVEHFSSMTPGPFVARLGDNWQQADIKTAVPGFDGELNAVGKTKVEKAVEKLKKKTQKLATVAPMPDEAFVAEVASKLNPPLAKLAEKLWDKHPNNPKNKSDKPQGKCAFMRAMLLEAKYTRKQIIDATLAKFGGEELGTSRTLSSLPSIMKKDGLVGKWVEA